jgi:hypothetical protein
MIEPFGKMIEPLRILPTEEELMKRISTALLLSAVTLGALPAAQAQILPGWLSFGRRKPAPAQTARQGSTAPATTPRASAPTPAATDRSVELAAVETRTVTIPGPVSPTTAGFSSPDVQLVNSRSLVIDFELKGLGPSGIGVVELWYTRNGQTWRKFGGAPQTQSPFVVNVTEDGLFGFTVVARNGMGVGKLPPKPGEPPQLWVDVDSTRPNVRLLGTQAGVDENGRTLALRWSALDRNLVARPITLSYAEQASGPWIPFATNVENSGYHTWRMSPGLPSQVLVRVEATDRVGNTGEDRSSMPAPIDLTRPTATIRNVSRNGAIQPVSGRR